MNTLYYGDNLDILKRYIKDESVDLVYLDPPFNSNRNYNVLFEEKNGTAAAAQIKVFDDTWKWDISAAQAYQEVVELGGNLSLVMQSFRTFLGESDMMAYLSMMAPRLLELHRCLKNTGSLYLHCDPNASHYLKLLLDGVFGPRFFRNEIIWKRKYGTSSYVHESNRFGTCTDTILYYVKTQDAHFTPQYNFDAPGYKEYVDKFFIHTDEKGRKYRIADLANPAPRPNLMYDYKGYKHPPNGWAISKEKMEAWDKEGRLYFPKSKDGRIQRKRFLDELKGKPIQSLWDDIEMISSQSTERLGYPTQKPEVLLERIIKASSKEGDIVLDPFCGCGTTINVAQKLNRQWIGIDITHLAISLMKHRLRDSFGKDIEYNVIGEPADLSGAQELAQSDPYQFQCGSQGAQTAR